MDITNLIAYILCAVLIAYLVIDGIKLRFRHRKVVADAMQLAVDKIALIQKVQELASKEDATSVEQTEGFLKFVSDSRDWAFEYIEEVQTAISDYVAALDNGDPDRIAESLEKLVGMLPENN